MLLLLLLLSVGGFMQVYPHVMTVIKGCLVEGLI